MIDEFLKIGLLILGAAFLFLYYLNARRSNIQSGRYQLKEASKSGLLVLTDTQTGTLYINNISMDKLAAYSYNPITKKREEIEEWGKEWGGGERPEDWGKRPRMRVPHYEESLIYVGDNKTKLRASYKLLSTGEVYVLLKIVEIDDDDLLPPFKDETDYPSLEGFKFGVAEGEGCNYITGIFPTPEEAQAWVAVQVASLKKHLDAWRSIHEKFEKFADEEFEI